MHAVDTERRERVIVVRVSGEVDAFAAPDLESGFTGVRGERRILVDLGSVSFMDSTALGVLVRCVREAREADAEVRVVLPRGTARRIFEITALESVLPVVADVSDGLGELGG